MSVQFKRSFEIEVGDISIVSNEDGPSLSVAFSVERDKRPEPNNAEVAIWNLNQDSRASLEKAEAVTVRMQVGYRDRIGQIFFGVLRKAETVRDGPDLVTRISGGDGEDKIVSAKISRTFARGTSVQLVLNTLIDSLGLGRGNASQLIGLEFLNFGDKLEKALTISGPVAEELDRFARSLGLEWSVQDGNFQIVKLGEPTQAGQGPLLSKSTGLVDIPRIDDKGNVLAKALILPDLIPGMPFRVESDAVTGNFVAEKTRHFGDSNAKEWYIDVNGKPINA